MFIHLSVPGPAVSQIMITEHIIRGPHTISSCSAAAALCILSAVLSLRTMYPLQVTMMAYGTISRRIVLDLRRKEGVRNPGPLTLNYEQNHG